jgi:hypothetical protein
MTSAMENGSSEFTAIDTPVDDARASNPQRQDVGGLLAVIPVPQEFVMMRNLGVECQRAPR